MRKNSLLPLQLPHLLLLLLAGVALSCDRHGHHGGFRRDYHQHPEGEHGSHPEASKKVKPPYFKRAVAKALLHDDDEARHHRHPGLGEGFVHALEGALRGDGGDAGAHQTKPDFLGNLDYGGGGFVGGDDSKNDKPKGKKKKGLFLMNKELLAEMAERERYLESGAEAGGGEGAAGETKPRCGTRVNLDEMERMGIAYSNWSSSNDGGNRDLQATGVSRRMRWR